MLRASSGLPSLLTETIAASLAYVVASFVSFRVLSPVQEMFFPAFDSHASLLFLPHGVRVLAGWLLGWRAVIALLPGVLIAIALLAGVDGVVKSAQMGVAAVALCVSPAVFHGLALLGWDIRPHPERQPCWPCVVFAGLLISALNALLTNTILDSAPEEYVAFLIGDFFGLIFLMMILMYLFRSLRLRDT